MEIEVTMCVRAMWHTWVSDQHASLAVISLNGPIYLNDVHLNFSLFFGVELFLFCFYCK